MRPWLVALLVGSGALSLSQAARADDERAEARELFRTAEAAFSRGEYRAAALAFEAADAKSPNGGAAYNAGIAWEKAGEMARAADAFARALGSGELADARLEDATKRLGALGAKLGVLTISAPRTATFTVAHVEQAKAPRRVHVAPGAHPVHVRWASGKTETRVVRVLAGSEKQLELVEPGPGDPGAEAAEEPATPPKNVGPSVEERDAGGGPWGWVLVSAGALSLATGTFLLSRGLSAREDFEASGRADADAHDRAVSYRTWSTVALLGGGALGGAGVVVLLASPKRADAGQRSAGWSLHLSPAGVNVVGRGW